MTHYYYLINSFPLLKIGEEPALNVEQLKVAFEENLSRKDKKEVRDFLFYLDLKNIKAFWLGFPLDARANFQEKELEEALLVPDSLPLYVYDFLDRYETKEERIRYFPFLYAQFFCSFKEGFSQEYFSQERKIRLHLAALKVKKEGGDIIQQMQFEDPQDLDVSYILAQKDREDYEPPDEYEPLKQIFLSQYQIPKALLKAYLQYRFRLIEEMEEKDVFSLPRVLAFLAKLLLVEQYQFLKQPQEEEVDRI